MELFDPKAILSILVGHSTIMTTANTFALVACILAIPATLAGMVTIGVYSPRFVLVSGITGMLDG